MIIKWLNRECTQAEIIRSTGVLWWRKHWRARVREGKYESDCWGWYYAVNSEPVDRDLGYELYCAKNAQQKRQVREAVWEEVVDLPAARVVEREP